MNCGQLPAQGLRVGRSRLGGGGSSRAPPIGAKIANNRRTGVRYFSTSAFLAGKCTYEVRGDTRAVSISAVTPGAFAFASTLPGGMGNQISNGYHVTGGAMDPFGGIV